MVAEVRYQLTPAPPAEIKAAVASLLAERKATQPTNKRTFGSVFKNPPAGPGAGRMIEECGLKGHRIGGALISTRHANFIENAGDATSTDAFGLMAEARRRVHERFGLELEHGVRLWGPARAPGGVGKPREAANTDGCPPEAEVLRAPLLCLRPDPGSAPGSSCPPGAPSQSGLR